MILKCRCGRQMAESSGAAGPGHYRCGCGWTVHVSAVHRGCAATSRGHRCGDKPRIAHPVPLCHRHLVDLLDGDDPAIDQAVNVAASRREVARVEAERERQEREEPHRAANRMREVLRRDALVDQQVVYYIRRGELIKIGTTTVMRQRMSNLMPDEILATEPGGREIEARRHRRFAHLRARGREWFTPAPDLLAHIADIRARHGEPVDTNYPTPPDIRP